MKKDGRKDGRAGQVVVEMMLILPIFFSLAFTIMEIGYISFQLIVLNHATYEVARIGGMTTTAPPAYGCDKLGEFMRQIIPTATISCNTVETLLDPQSGQTNFDLEITGNNSVKLVFPISSVLLAKPKGTGTRMLQAKMRMPIETPLRK